MNAQQHPDYHEGFFDALDGEPLLECSRLYMSGWIAAHECQSYFDQDWESMPAEIKAKFPEHYARQIIH